jgi:hypothetical protein
MVATYTEDAEHLKLACSAVLTRLPAVKSSRSARSVVMEGGKLLVLSR